MRRDIQPNERAYSSKEAAETVGIATPTVRKYGQILERNGYEFLKDGDRRIFVQSDLEALKALRDTEKPLDDTAKTLVVQQAERLEGSDKKEIAVSDTYQDLPSDPSQIKEILMVLVKELAATREMNVQLTSDMASMKTKVSQLQQDHHVISSSIGNSAQRTNSKIEKLMEMQTAQYEQLLQDEKEKSEQLRREIQMMREEQQREWRSLNTRIEVEVSKPKEKWGGFLSLFRK
ncbi:hypothetical protein LRR81_19550 [Metabacillus sp. GX 13764]|uniref:hypothetical protein n=1 Tax=Metabacillus kandeliae TaxID=2900151 RepID=UPI001E57EB76|nr:hypothetical protein [Metabacillus kandeliae]MCD7036447.1 hypothetical protein [Metabacillus kandeliae]